MKNALGFDLGTTFSSVAIISKNNLELVSDVMNRKDIPSIVNFFLKNGELDITVGSIASKRQTRNPQMTVYDSKRMLGRRFDDESIQHLKDKWPFNIERSDSGGILISLDGIEKKYQPYEISGEILKYLAKIGNSRLPPEEQTNNAVITIPANFGEEQRTETMKAAKYAGLNVLQLINEPTAAGLAYGLKNPGSEKRHIFVFDFGGGTLDVSVLKIQGKEITVLQTDGDMFLGGRDFDDNMIDFLIKEYELDDDFRDDPKIINQLREAVIDAKKELSTSETAIIIPKNDKFDEYEMSLDLFEEINEKLIDKILDPVKRVLEASKIEKEQIDAIILVGGSSNMQFVKRKLQDYFGKSPFYGVNPEEAVAIGAGIVASKYIETVDSGSLMKTLDYKDICPISIGTSNVDGTMTVLIPKGTQIPTKSKPEQFHTVLYRQDTFPVDIYEGESQFVKNNFPLGEFTVFNLPPSEDEIVFDVTFSLDQNCILSAQAQLVGGDLSGGTEIPIKDRKPKSFDVKDDDTQSFSNPLINENKLFYNNIQRLINFNREKFDEVYTKSTVNQFLSQVDYKLKNIETEYVEINDLIREYRKKFGLYFRNHTVPKFLS